MYFLRKIFKYNVKFEQLGEYFLRRDYGVIQKGCHSHGRGGLDKKMTKCDIGGGCLSQRVILVLQKYIIQKFNFDQGLSMIDRKSLF